MNAEYNFQEDFLNALDGLKQDVDRALIYSVHVLSSDRVGHDQKQKVCDDVARIGKEVNGRISKFNLKDVTVYNVREKEKAFIEDSKALHGEFESFLTRVDRSCGVRIDRNMLFSISDIVEKLSSTKLYSEFGFTKDKVDNLLSIKNLIVGVHKSQIESAAEKEKKLDKQFIELKERTFNESVRSAGNKNAIYCFRSVELLKKFIQGGASAAIINDDRALNGNEIGFRIKGEQRIIVEYSFGGLSIEMDVEKGKTDTYLTYKVIGSIEKGVSKVDFRIDESVSFVNGVAFERVSGIDFLWAQYEKAYIDFQQARQKLGKKQEQLDREIVDKAIDDLLFR